MIKCNSRLSLLLKEQLLTRLLMSPDWDVVLCRWLMNAYSDCYVHKNNSWCRCHKYWPMSFNPCTNIHIYSCAISNIMCYFNFSNLNLFQFRRKEVPYNNFKLNKWQIMQCRINQLLMVGQLTRPKLLTLMAYFSAHLQISSMVSWLFCLVLGLKFMTKYKHRI